MRLPQPLPADIAEILERGAVASEPPIPVRERLRARLTLGLASPVTLLRPVARGTGLAAAFASNRVLLGALAGFVVGVAGTWALRGQPVPSTAAPLAAAPIRAAPVAELKTAPVATATTLPAAPQGAASLAPAPAIQHRFVRRARLELTEGQPQAHAVLASPEAPPAASNAAQPQNHWGLQAEGELLQKGRTAMVRGDTEGALAAVEEHASRFPGGKLAEEREALKIQALVAEDRTPEAHAALGTFEHDYPNSLLGPALEEAVIGRIQ
jgi:hypothetical protein